jgi:Mrp family chromosome partitioning ATPase
VSFAGRSNVPRTVMFTSTRDNDSAAIIAAAVARIAAADGERVLLIEADLQHPMLGKILGSRGNGMADILTDFADWRDVVERDGQVDLDMLLSNQRLGGADGLLGGLAFQTLLLEAREDYDLVVIEAPVADSSEAAILAPRVDAAIMVTDMRARRGDLGSTAAKLTTASRNPVQALLVT